LKGASAVPVDPIYFESIAPSVEEAPPETEHILKCHLQLYKTHRLSVVVGEVG
jgi:hypothetical protein